MSAGVIASHYVAGPTIPWLNHVTILAPGASTHTNVDPANPTATGTVKDGAAFTPTAGRFLVCVAASAASTSTPSGWTLNTGASSVNSQGLYFFSKTAAGSGGDKVTTTHNAGSPYMVTFDFYEFSSSLAFYAATGALTNSGQTRSLSGLPAGTTIVLTGFVGPTIAGSIAWSGATSQVEYDTSSGFQHYGLAYTVSTASSISVAATLEQHEQVMFAIR